MADSNCAMPLAPLLMTTTFETAPAKERPLTELAEGDTGHIARIDATDGQLRKLLALGFLPGVRVEVIRTFPAYLVRMGFSQFAVDAQVARAIVVVR